MELADEILVSRTKGNAASGLIQLLFGDLAAIPEEHRVDLLAVSAFPDSYHPEPGTLFQALFRSGLDMERVAADKREDERKHLGCWLSREMPPQVIERLHFHRILCFEPSHPDFKAKSVGSDIAANVSYVFRCLNNFVIPGLDAQRDFQINKVAMPVLATGNQKVPLEVMLPQLLEAAIFWLEQGLPVQELKIVVFRKQDQVPARNIFNVVGDRYRSRRATGPQSVSWEDLLAERLQLDLIETCKRELQNDLKAAATEAEKDVLDRLFKKVATGSERESNSRLPESARTKQYDMFISYAHAHDQQVLEFVTAIKRKAPSLEIFYDRASIPAGGQWIKAISDAVDRADTFIAILSPEYSASPVCWDEFQCAKLKEYNTRKSVIKTVRLFKEKNMPPIMGIYSYIDCAEGDLDKLRNAGSSLG